MVRAISIIMLLITVAVESRGQRQADNNDLIKVDVKKSYSQKKELILQDFTDVEYIPLETNDDFVNQGLVRDIGKKFIIVTNRIIGNGDIFVYSRTGKAIRKINHKGYSGNEYAAILGIILDEDNNEMFVNDPQTRKILVYDLSGKFKRGFKHNVSAKKTIFYTNIFNYDKNNLLCDDGEENEDRSFVLISKQDGSITKEIKIPSKKKISSEYKKKGPTSEKNGVLTVTTTTTIPYHSPKIISFNGNWMLLELSSDTIYTFLPDYSLHPFLARTPSIQSMSPSVFLTLNFFSDRYIFMETIKNEYNQQGFPRTYFMYDKQEKDYFGYTIYNDDLTTKKGTALNGLTPGNHGAWSTIDAYRLIELYQKGELQGKLKEIAAKLDEDDNAVIMLVKQKK